MTRTVEILDRLVAFDTVSARPNLAIADYAQAHLTACGFDVTRFPDGTGQKAGLYARRGGAGRGVLLSGHTDVVPVEGQDWTSDPFRLTQDGDRLFGRGTTDMKGFVASALALAERATGVELKEPLGIVLSYDEEVGCIGIRQMLDRLAPLVGQPRACIVGEPTEMQVAIGHKGKAALRATCRGRGGHSALAPRFLNALHLATDFVAGLRELQDAVQRTGARDEAYDVPFTTFHVGRVQGGMALNVVPDRAVVDFEYRHLAADLPADLMARIEALANRVAHSCRADFPEAAIGIETLFAYPGLAVAAEAEVVALASRFAGGTGTTKVAYGTEAGYFDQLGIPTVVCGPGSMEGQGHKPDEYITTGQLAACDAMMERVLGDLTAG